MRINVYAEELTTQSDLVTKTVTDDEYGTRTFYGLRLWLHSPPELHHGGDDDDRSAITFWVPWTRGEGHDFPVMDAVIQALFSVLLQARQDAPPSRYNPVSATCTVAGGSMVRNLQDVLGTLEALKMGALNRDCDGDIVALSGLQSFIRAFAGL